MTHQTSGLWNLKKNPKMTTENKFEQLRQATGGFKKSDTIDRFRQELAHTESRKKSQLVALKILRTLRTRGMSQKQFADQLNVTPQQVSKWVKGSENFTFETIEKIEKALGIILIDVVHNRQVPVLTKVKPVTRPYQLPKSALAITPISNRMRIKNRSYVIREQYT